MLGEEEVGAIRVVAVVPHAHEPLPQSRTAVEGASQRRKCRSEYEDRSGTNW